MSTENVVSEIGKTPGFAMAASEKTGMPGPSGEVPEGADMPTKENVTLRLITCFTGRTTTKQQHLDACFLSHNNTGIRVMYNVYTVRPINNKEYHAIFTNNSQIITDKGILCNIHQ